MQFCLGLVFAGSALAPFLSDAYEWDEATAIAPYRYALGLFSVGMLVGWRFQEVRGARLTAALGGVLASFAMVLSALFSHHPQALVASFGVVGGFGLGFSFMAPISAVLRAFPAQERLFGAAALSGIAAGGVCLPLLLEWMLANAATAAETSAPAIAAGLGDTFALMAILLLVGLVGCSRILPVEEERAARSNPWVPRTLAGVFRAWLLWVVFFLGATATVASLVQASPVLTPEAGSPYWIPAGAFIFVMGYGNLLGERFWGELQRRYGQIRMRGMVFGAASVASLVLGGGSFSMSLFVLVLATAGFCCGGFLAVMPTLARQMLEFRSLAEAAAIVVAAYGASSLFRLPALPQGEWLALLDGVLMLGLCAVFFAGSWVLLREDRV